jgi:peptidyl-prolyl cis-trans isomerase B (cyclophilin B)
MIQGGCPKGNGTGGPDYEIKGEFAANGFEQNDIPHTRGVISMARGGHSYDSAGSQFFICVADNASVRGLDGLYAAFGKVIEGMDIADEIASGPNTGGQEMRALEPRVMRKVTVEETEDGRVVATLEIEG